MKNRELHITLANWNVLSLTQLGRALSVQASNSDSPTQRMIANNYLVEVIRELEERTGSYQDELRCLHYFNSSD